MTERRIEAFLSTVMPSLHAADSANAAVAIVPWLCDVLLSENSLEAYGRDLAHFDGHMQQLGVAPFDITADHVKLYKASLLKADVRSATVSRRLSVIRGAYRQFADKGLVSWDTAQGIVAVKAPPVRKNSTPALTQQQAIALLGVIDTDSLQGRRDFALLHTFFITGCRVTAIVRARVGDLEFDGTEDYLHVVEKRGYESRKILLDAGASIRQYIGAAGTEGDREGALFRPMSPDRLRLLPRHMNRKTPWRLVKKYCRLAGIEADRLTGRGIGVHSLRKTAITNAIRNGAHMHEVREFAGHSDIRTTELYYVRREEDAEQAARRITIRRDTTQHEHT